jgi:hypothetical protein
MKFSPKSRLGILGAPVLSLGGPAIGNLLSQKAWVARGLRTEVSPPFYRSAARFFSSKVGASSGPLNAEFSAPTGAGFAQHRLSHLRGDREMEGLVR